MRVKILGNLVVDTILNSTSSINYDGSNEVEISRSLGGVANFARAAKGLFDFDVFSFVGSDSAVVDSLLGDLGISYKKLHGVTPQAFIVSDKFNAVRHSYVDWGIYNSNILNWPYDNHCSWHHLMYLDRMCISLDDLKEFRGIVSADFCSSESVSDFYEYLPYVDYLIVSDVSEGCSLTKRDLPVRKGLVVHTPSYGYCRFGESIWACDFKVVRGLNVNGAGDYFSAHIISELLLDRLPNLMHAYDFTVKCLRKQS